MAPPGRLSRAGLSVSPKPPNNPIKPIRPNTRSAQATQRTLRDMMNPPDASSDQDIQDAKAGSAFLVDSGFIEADEPVTPDRLANAMLTASRYKGLADIPRQVLTSAAFIIRDMALTAQADDLVSKVTSSLNNSVIVAIAPHVAQLFDASVKLSSLNTNLMATQDKLEETTKAIVSQHQNDSGTPSPPLGEDLAMIRSAITDLKDLVSSTGPHHQPAHSPYRNALLTQQQPRETVIQASDDARANAARKERQLLLDIARDHPAVSNNILTRLELITLFQKVITATSTEEANAPDLQLKSLRVLHNGGILLELPSKQVANWLKDNDRLQKMAVATGGKLTFKDRSYNVVVPFVPTTTLIKEQETLRSIENENELPAGSIAVARWIKPAHCRDAGQRVAHALFRLTTPEAANTLIKNGMYINLERLRPAKDKKEPLQCLKCQRWGHMAKDCSTSRDTCGTCAKNHRTNACPSTKTVHCVSCNTDDHASWSRSCPEFKQKSWTLDENTPENQMPFFPTDEPWTQVNLPPKPTSQLVPTRPPLPPPRTQGNTHAKMGTQGRIDNHFQHRNSARRNESAPPPPRPSSPAQTNTLAAPKNADPPQPSPQQQTPPSPSGHPPSIPTTSQESESSHPATPTPREPAPFPPISPLSNPPPMPTPPPYMKPTTPAETSPPHSPV